MVVDSFSFGGAENLLAELGRHATAALDITVASLVSAEAGRHALLERLSDAGLRPMFFSMRRLLDPRGFVALVRRLRGIDVDVVHAHLGYSAIVVPLAARLAGKPVVATLHVRPAHHPGPGEWLKERLAVRIPGRLGRLVLVSADARDDYARRHGPARDTWRVIHNGVDTNRYTPRPNVDPATAHPPVWAVVAALRPDKNHVGLLRAWAGVVAARPDALLLIVGDGPSREEIENTAAELGVSGSVRFLGRQENIAELLHRVDGVVSASVDEALPTALIEAAACGLPVVAADVGGTREIVIDGVNGRLVPLRDEQAMTTALLEAIADPERARRYGAAGTQIVESDFAMPLWVSRLRDLYSEVIDEAPRWHRLRRAH